MECNDTTASSSKVTLQVTVSSSSSLDQVFFLNSTLNSPFILMVDGAWLINSSSSFSFFLFFSSSQVVQYVISTLSDAHYTGITDVQIAGMPPSSLSLPLLISRVPSPLSPLPFPLSPRYLSPPPPPSLMLLIFY